MPIKSQLADIEIPHIPFHDLIIDSLKKYATNVALVSHFREIFILSLITVFSSHLLSNQAKIYEV